MNELRQSLAHAALTHPAVHDLQGKLQRLYGVQVWPTYVLIDPAGNVVVRRYGQSVQEALDGVIARVIRTFDMEGTINRRPLELIEEKAGG